MCLKGGLDAGHGPEPIENAWAADGDHRLMEHSSIVRCGGVDASTGKRDQAERQPANRDAELSGAGSSTQQLAAGALKPFSRRELGGVRARAPSARRRPALRAPPFRRRIAVTCRPQFQCAARTEYARRFGAGGVAQVAASGLSPLALGCSASQQPDRPCAYQTIGWWFLVSFDAAVKLETLSLPAQSERTNLLMRSVSTGGKRCAALWVRDVKLGLPAASSTLSMPVMTKAMQSRVRLQGL